MAITIDGTGSITGINAGGLPDGCVTNADLEYAGTDGQVLTSTGASTAPAWEDLPTTSGTAFAYVSSSGTTRTNHYNVSSITQPQTGYYTINFTSAASSTNVTVVATTLGNYGVKTIFVTNGSTTACGVVPGIATNGAGTNANFCLAVFD